MGTNNTSDRKDTRDSLLNELESIRSLLKEHSEDNQPQLSNRADDNTGEIPVLQETIPILNDTVPTLNDRIPLLETPSRPAGDAQMASMRAAAAMIAAKAVRNRDPVAPPAVEQKPQASDQARRDNEQIITAVIDELRPQLESLLRNALRKHFTGQGNNPKGNP